jgi:putative transposase
LQLRLIYIAIYNFNQKSDAYRVKDQSAAYFIPLTIIDWVDVFTRKEYKEILIESLKYALQGRVCMFMICNNE